MSIVDREDVTFAEQLDRKSPDISERPWVLSKCVRKSKIQTGENAWGRRTFTNKASDCSTWLEKGLTPSTGKTEEFQVLLERVMVALQDC